MKNTTLTAVLPLLAAVRPGWRRNIAGTREPNSGGLTGVQRVLDVFIGGCVKATVCSDIKEFCTTNGLELRDCISLPTKAQCYVAV